MHDGLKKLAQDVDKTIQDILAEYYRIYQGTEDIVVEAGKDRNGNNHWYANTQAADQATIITLKSADNHPYLLIETPTHWLNTDPSLMDSSPEHPSRWLVDTILGRSGLVSIVETGDNESGPPQDNVGGWGSEPM